MEKKLFIFVALISFSFYSCEKGELSENHSNNLEIISSKGQKLKTIEETKKIASDFFNSLKGDKVLRSSSEVDSENNISREYTVNVSDSLDLHVFNFTDNGFVIVNPSSKGPIILAFSDSETLSDDFLKSGVFLIWKDCMVEPLISNIKLNPLSSNVKTRAGSGLDSKILNTRIGALSANDWKVLNAYLQTTKKETMIKSPILNTAWSQRSPYNNLCPNNYPAGCVAISVGQIINHHKKWTGKTWNWNNINNSVTPEISQFIKDIGSGVKMVYGKDGSHPDWTNINFLTNLNYRECKFLESIGYSTKDDLFFSKHLNAWNAIKEGRPIIMSGYKKEVVVPIDGHSWVADGIKAVTFEYLMDEDQAAQYGVSHPGGYEALFVSEVLDTQLTTYFHFNMGWGGTDNGWYFCQYNTIIDMDNLNNSYPYKKHVKFVDIK